VCLRLLAEQPVRLLVPVRTRRAGILQHKDKDKDKEEKEKEGEEEKEKKNRRRRRRRHHQ
jgi:hypothetical protein